VAVTFARRVVRTVRRLAGDGDLPRWLRWLAALGLAPIPGPFDEAVLLVVAAILWLGYRERLRAAWRDAKHEAERTDQPHTLLQTAAKTRPQKDP
jgi:hypothetical protein